MSEPAAGAGSASGSPSTSRLSALVDSLHQDLRFALRSLRSTPGFTAVAVACLAIGISANTTMFGVADRLFLRPPPGIRDPGRVVRVYLDRERGGVRTPGGGPGSFPDYQDLHAGTTSGPAIAFSGVAAFVAQRVAYGAGAEVRRLEGQAVTAGYFDVLGTRPALGRFFLSEEDSIPGTHPVAVLSYNFWQREFAGAPGVLGRVITLDGRPFTVVGVAERGFSGFDLQALDLWLPMREMRTEMGPEMFTERHAIWIEMVARLAPDVSARIAEARASAVKQRVDAVAAPDLDKDVRVMTGPLLEADGPKRDAHASIALWLLAAVALVLIIACANVANLLLARGTRRRREVAIRLSLGARRQQLVRQLLVESLVLALAGGMMGLLLTVWSAGAVRMFSLPASASALDGRALAFTAAVAMLTALVFGLIPALATTRSDLVASLKDGSRRSGGGQSHLQSGLLVAQAALSLVVLAGAGLFVRSLRNMHAIDLGLDADHIMLATIDLQGTSYDSVAKVELYRRAVEQLSAQPGVTGVSFEGLPPFRGVMGLRTRLPGRDSSDRDQRGTFVNFVGSDFLRANGTPLRRGRDISDQDRAGTLPVAVVNETMARRLWPGQDPIGQCILVPTGPPGTAAAAPPPCTTVVGVMGDGKYVSMTEDPLAYFVLPYAQLSMGLPPTLVIRSRGDPRALEGAVRQTIAGLVPDRSEIDIRALGDELDPQMQPYRIGAVLFTAFGLVALALAAMGLYGVVAYLVAQRTQEAGVRLALGARGIDVLTLMLRRGMTPAFIGVGIGLIGAVMVTRVFRSQLYGVSPTDPLTLVGVGGLLCVVAAIACYLPARRAARIDPVTALRSE